MVAETRPFKSFVGVDLHKCQVTLRAVDGNGVSLGGVTLSTKCVQKIHDWLLTRRSRNQTGLHYAANRVSLGPSRTAPLDRGPTP